MAWAASLSLLLVLRLTAGQPLGHRIFLPISAALFAGWATRHVSHLLLRWRTRPIQRLLDADSAPWESRFSLDGRHWTATDPVSPPPEATGHYTTLGLQITASFNELRLSLAPKHSGIPPAPVDSRPLDNAELGRNLRNGCPPRLVAALADGDQVTPGWSWLGQARLTITLPHSAWRTRLPALLREARSFKTQFDAQPSQRPIVLTLAQHPSPELRAAAVSLLPRLAPPGWRVLLHDALNDPVPAVRLAAAETADGGPARVAVLRALASSGPARLRRPARVILFRDALLEPPELQAALSDCEDDEVAPILTALMKRRALSWRGLQTCLHPGRTDSTRGQVWRFARHLLQPDERRAAQAMLLERAPTMKLDEWTGAMDAVGAIGDTEARAELKRWLLPAQLIHSEARVRALRGALAQIDQRLAPQATGHVDDYPTQPQSPS